MIKQILIGIIEFVVFVVLAVAFAVAIGKASVYIAANYPNLATLVN